jgi:hypothetical protein
MDEYWKPVLSDAWENTYRPLGWDRKKVALAILAVGTVLVAGFRLGWAAMMTGAAGYLWLLAPIVFAAAVLFVWGIIEAQAKAYRSLEQRISELIQDKVTPNYESWRHIPIVTLGQASYLWCDRKPLSGETKDTRSWFRALEAAIQTRDIEIIPKPSLYHEEGENERRNPNWDSKIKKTELRKFADKHGHPTPKFLQDEWIKSAAA